MECRYNNDGESDNNFAESDIDVQEDGDRDPMQNSVIISGDDDNEHEGENYYSVNIRVTERNKNNAFYMMAYKVAVKCHRDTKNEEGSHENLYYCPSVIPNILNLCAYLPLWTGIMCKKVGFGTIPPSSAPIESQFNDLKHRVFKHSSLPMRIDDFLKHHTKSLDGTAKLVYSTMLTAKDRDTSTWNRNCTDSTTQTIQPTTVIESEMIPDPVPSSPAICSLASVDSDMVTESIVPSAPAESEATFLTSIGSCPCCARGDTPTGAHKCVSCHQPVHILEGCSISVGDEEGYGERRLCISCEKLGANKN